MAHPIAVKALNPSQSPYHFLGLQVSYVGGSQNNKGFQQDPGEYGGPHIRQVDSRITKITFGQSGPFLNLSLPQAK